MKSAKTDAAKEIEEYKKQKEQELKKFEAEYVGDNADADTNAAEHVKTEVAKIKAAASAKEKDVVKLLVDAVTNPLPEIHSNAAI